MFLFVLIVKSDIEFYVLSVDKSNDFYLVCRGDHRSSELVSVTAAHPSIAETKISISPVGVDVHDDPRKIWVRAAHPSIAKKRDLREPSPAGEHVASDRRVCFANVEGTACGG